MPTLTYADLNKALPVLRTLAAERHYSDQRVAVRIARMKGEAERAFEPVREVIRKLQDEYGQTGPVKCPHCRGQLWESDQKQVMPNGPNWGTYEKQVEEALTGGEVEIPGVLKLDELTRFVVVEGVRERDEEGVVLSEPIPFGPDEMVALGPLLDMGDGEEEENPAAKKTGRRRAAAKS